MSDLGIWTLGLVLVMLVVHGTCLVKPQMAGALLVKFTRSVWAGRILATIALLWSAWLVSKMPLGSLEYLKKYLFVVTPAVIGGVFYFMDDLLAPRALGGLLMLYPAPVLAMARLNDSRLSLIMSVVCYILVVKGMILVLNPWWYRKAIERITVSAGRVRVVGGVGVAFALLLMCLAFFVY